MFCKGAIPMIQGRIFFYVQLLQGGGSIKNRTVIIAFLLFCVGLLIVSIPTFSGMQLEVKAEQAAAAFYERHLPSNDETPSSEPSEGGVLLYPELYEAMKDYNAELYRTHQAGLTDAWAYQAPVLELSDYGVDDDVFGTISIPKLSVTLPLYLGATEEHMALGAAQLSQTSFPIGGENTNAVIAGHRGWNGYPYFMDIEKLQKGDTVTIRNLWGELTYKVTEIRIVYPDDIEAILIQEGKDMITLMTCHPPNSGGKYRYLVFCERTETTGGDAPVFIP